MSMSAVGNCRTGARALAAHYRGEIRGLEWRAAATSTLPDDLDLAAMAKRALNYLRGNPDPQRAYECKFSLGPLGIPAHVPLLPPNKYGHDPIALGDTDCRMDWQYPHMREMAGEPQADEVERGVRRRILGYRHADDNLVWMNPAAWVGPLTSPSAIEALKHEWAFTWASGKLLYSLAEEFQRSGDPALKRDCRALFLAIQGLASRDAEGRAFLPHGAAPWRKGTWLHLADAGSDKGWGGELAHGYPFVTAPLVRYWECTGDSEALALARAFAEGHLAGVQPDMAEQRIDPRTGAFGKHVHLHTHEVWGVAHLGAVTGEAKYLDWAERAYRFVATQGTDYGWYPEYIPQHEYRTEICVVGDMTSIAASLARGGRPEFYDHVERTVRNTLRKSQFACTPEFVALFREIHRDRSSAEVDAALAELRKLEGGFVAQPGLNDWVSYPDNPKLGMPGLYANGIQMMGCCPPEGMRGLWEAWQATVEERADGVFVNLPFSRTHGAARVTAFRPEDGGLAVAARRAGDYFLRPPAWAARESVACLREGAPGALKWGGPADAYVLCRSVGAGEELRLTWAVPRFQQVFEPQSVPGRRAPITVAWTGNTVLGVTPNGRHLPMYAGRGTGVSRLDTATDNPAKESAMSLPRTRQLVAEKKPVRVVLYGDSISEVGRAATWNGGATSPEANWGSVLVRRLAEKYPGSAFTVHHFAIGGQNSYEGLGRLDGLEAFAPDLVLLSFGANDCAYHFLLPEETKLALGTLATGIRKRFGADVVLAGTGGDNPLKPFFQHLEATLAAQREAADEAGVPFLDLRQAVLAATGNGERWAEFHISEANCHPVDRGHAVWAEAALALVCAAVGR